MYCDAYQLCVCDMKRYLFSQPCFNGSPLAAPIIGNEANIDLIVLTVALMYQPSSAHCDEACDCVSRDVTSWPFSGDRHDWPYSILASVRHCNAQRPVVWCLHSFPASGQLMVTYGSSNTA